MDSPPFHPDDLIQHRDALRRMARALVGEVECAEDVVQSTFLTALESPPRAPKSLRAWLTRILRSRAIDTHRSRARRHDAEARLAEERRSPGEVVDHLLDQQLSLADEVMDAVRELKNPYRRTVLLRYFEGLPPREIAKRLDLPVATVKTQIARGLEKLRGRISRELLAPGEEHDQRTLGLALAPLSRSATTKTITSISLGWQGFVMWKKLTWIGAAILATLATWLLVERWTPPATEEIAVVPERETAGPKQAARDARPDQRATPRSAMGPDEPPRPTPFNEGTLLIRAVWSDGSPAAGLGIRARSATDPLVGRSIRGVVTDAGGLARVEGLAPGTVLLESDRAGPNPGESTPAEVVPGEERSVIFRQPKGVSVGGLVVDEQGRPVANAGIWLATSYRDWRGGRVIARCDADGEFQVRDIQHTQSIGAVAAGFGPSELLDLELIDTSASPLQVQLVLRGEGVELSGVVVGPDRKPVPGARVALGHRPMYDQARVDGTTIEAWSPRVLTTGASGTFRIDGLAQGPTRLTVLADGYAEHREVLELVPATSMHVEVRLQEGVRVHGVVRTEDGAPVEGALVMALDAPFRHPVPDQGPYDVSGAFHFPAVRSLANGNFELPPIPPGDAYLYASKGARFWRGSTLWNGDATEFAGATQETVHLGEAGAFEWSPVLSLGSSIHGFALYADGTPMIWARVIALDEETGERFADDSTGSDGSFSIPGLRDTPYSVTIHNDEAPAGVEPVSQRSVWPSEDPLELRAHWSRNRAPLGSIKGRWRDSAERLSSATQPTFLLEDEGLTAWEHAVLDGDLFRFEHVAAGRYRVRALSENDPVQAWSWFELAPGQDLDLGLLETEPGGTLRVNIQREDGFSGPPFTLMVIAPERYYPTRRTVDAGASSVTIEQLAPGPHEVRFAAKGISFRPLSVTIRAHETLEVTKPLERGVLASLTISNPGEHAWNELTITLREGDSLYEQTTYSSSRMILPTTSSYRLPLGRFEATITTDSGLSARGVIDIDSFDEPPGPLALDLAPQ